MNEEVSFDVELKKLELKDNTVVVLKCLKDYSYNEISQILSATYEAMKPYRDLKVRLIVLPKDITLETLDEKEMNRVGWFRKEEKRIIVPN